MKQSICIGYMLIALFCFTNRLGGIEAARPQLLNATVRYETSNFLGAEFELATADLQFDQELYVAKMMVCPGMEVGCNPVDKKCVACDWTRAQLPCLGTEQLDCCQTFTAPETSASWCEVGDKQWNSLLLDEVSDEIAVASNKWIYFRFYVGNTDFCKPLEIITHASAGSLDMFVSTIHPFPDAQHSEWNRYTYWSLGQTSLTLCPSHDAYRTGTFSIGIRG